MKRTFNFALIVIMFLVTVITFLLYFTEEMRNLFMGSIESTTKIFSSNYFVVVAFNIGAISSLIFYFKKVRFSILFFIIFLFLWILSGRVIGVHYTGELTLGWFFIKTERIVLWRENECIGDVLNDTDYNHQFPFMLHYQNSCTIGKTYAGPFIISDIQTYLNK